MLKRKIQKVIQDYYRLGSNKVLLLDDLKTSRKAAKERKVLGRDKSRPYNSQLIDLLS